MRTASTSTWDLKTNKLQIGDKELAQKGFVRFEPQLPYLYLPEAFYKIFAEEINKKYDKKICDIDKNVCKFE